jgi:hypothetical protein
MFGARHDFFRVEVAVLAAMDALEPAALTIGVIHDCQLVELAPDARPAHAALLDFVVTPTRLLEGTVRQQSQPARERIDGKTMKAVLATLQGTAARDERVVGTEWLLSQDFGR